jgi:hypothetical protein
VVVVVVVVVSSTATSVFVFPPMTPPSPLRTGGLRSPGQLRLSQPRGVGASGVRWHRPRPPHRPWPPRQRPPCGRVSHVRPVRPAQRLPGGGGRSGGVRVCEGCRCCTPYRQAAAAVGAGRVDSA